MTDTMKMEIDLNSDFVMDVVRRSMEITIDCALKNNDKVVALAAEVIRDQFSIPGR